MADPRLLRRTLGTTDSSGGPGHRRCAAPVAHRQHAPRGLRAQADRGSTLSRLGVDALVKSGRHWRGRRSHTSGASTRGRFGQTGCSSSSRGTNEVGEEIAARVDPDWHAGSSSFSMREDWPMPPSGTTRALFGPQPTQRAGHLHALEQHHAHRALRASSVGPSASPSVGREVLVVRSPRQRPPHRHPARAKARTTRSPSCNHPRRARAAGGAYTRPAGGDTHAPDTYGSALGSGRS